MVTESKTKGSHEDDKDHDSSHEEENNTQSPASCVCRSNRAEKTAVAQQPEVLVLPKMT
jgi:hypothetical protein